MSSTTRVTAQSQTVLEGMQQAVDILEVGMIAVDRDLRVLCCSSWLERVTDLPGDEIVGKSIIDLFPAIAGTEREAAFRRAIAGETVLMAHRFHEYLIPVPERASAPAAFMQQSARIVPLPDVSGHAGAVAFIQDVTERVEREAELRKAKETAELASKAKSDFLAAMSHELRTPLNAVIGYSELLAHGVGGSKLDDRQMQHTQRIITSAWHLISIIDQVLTFSRAEAGHEEVRLTRVDMCEQARRAMNLVEPQALAKQLTLDLQTESDPMMLETDELRIQQILINLLGNAVKFTDAGTVLMSVHREANDMVVRVIDTGPGIPPSHTDDIFEAFTQVDQSATRAKGGTGLGLPVSRKLAELLGGTLTLESSTARGSTFTLRVPATE